MFSLLLVVLRELPHQGPPPTKFQEFLSKYLCSWQTGVVVDVALIVTAFSMGLYRLVYGYC